MGFRWLAILIVASLVTLGLAAGTAAGIQALLPLMILEWVDDRWLKIASLLAISFPPAYFAVQTYRRKRSSRSG
jgi:hypothetical protein